VLLDLDPGMVTMIIFVVVTAYTLAGGFHSVVATDAVQGVILLAGGMLLPLSMVVREGGVTALLGKVRRAMPSVLEWQPEGALAGDVTVGTLVGLALGVGLKIIVEPRQLSRFYGLADDEQLRRGRWIAPAMLFVTYLVMLPVGFLAHAFVTPGELGGGSGRALTDNVIPHLLGSKVNLLGPVAGAFFLTGLVAAAMSSIDSVLLVAASSADHDLVAPGRADDGVGVRRTRVWVFLLSAVAAVLSLILDQGITEMSSFSGSLYAACFLPSLIVGLFWKRLGRTAALLALITGFATTLGWFILKQTGCLGDLRKVHEVYVGVACSHVVAVTMTVLGRGGRR
jgi:Na+/proline symporter